MFITTDLEKEQIRKQFKGILAVNGYTMKSYCKKFNLDYFQTYQIINRYKSIDIDKINEMVALIEPRKKLQVIAGSWVISVKF
jgi:hypothetical protein